MKKISIILVVLVLVGSIVPWNLTAQTSVLNWLRRSSGTVAWDAVAKVDAADDPVKYQVYSRAFGSAESTAQKVGAEITATQLAVTIPTDVKMVFGVKALRYKAGAFLDDSDFAWSDNVTACADGQTFGFDTIIQIGTPTRMRTP